MLDEENEGETEATLPSDDTENTAQDIAVESSAPHNTVPRIWPACAIIVAHFASVAVVKYYGATTLSDFYPSIAAPLLGSLLLVIWWLTASRVPLKDRLLGVVLFVAALGAILVSQPGMPIVILGVLPVMTTAIVATLLLSAPLHWAMRRWLTVAVLLATTATFLAMRVDGFSGNLTPNLSWRWETTGETFLADSETSPSNQTATLPTALSPGDWPGFRGAERDGRLVKVSFDTDWSTLPKELWRRPVGRGLSSFAVIGDYFFTQEQRGDSELVVCYRTETGEEVWVNRIDARYENMIGGGGPRATPTYHAGKLYTVGATGIVQCIDASTGVSLWTQDLRADTGAELPVYGYASSPLIVGDLAIVFRGGADDNAVAAYQLASGDLAWTSGKGDDGYSSGQLANFGDIPQVLMNSDFGLQSFVPETGKVLWEHAWATKSNPRVVQPLVHDSRSVLIGTAGGQGTRLLHVQKGIETWSVEKRWTTKKFRPYFNDFVFHEGFCYGFDGNRLKCFDPLTGNIRWTGGRVGGQVLAIDEIDMLLVLTEKGDVLLVEALTDRYTEVARFHALDGKTWNHPVIANGKLFVRNNDEAVCYLLPTKEIIEAS